MAQVIFLKFHPLVYFHVFLFGMCLARLRHLALAAERAAAPSWSGWAVLVRACCTGGASVGYLLLLGLVYNAPCAPGPHTVHYPHAVHLRSVYPRGTAPLCGTGGPSRTHASCRRVSRS